MRTTRLKRVVAAGRRPGKGAVLLATLGFTFVLGGCGTARGLFPENRKEQKAANDLLQLQQRNMRYADLYTGSIIQATKGAESGAGNAESRYELSGWLLAEANAAYTDASGSNAYIATLDLVTLATLSRMVIEDTGAKLFPEQAAAMLVVHRELEVEAWKLTDGVLTEEQQAELRRMMNDWRASHPESVYAPFVRFQEFVNQVNLNAGKGTSSSSLMGLIGLDPLAGLDPAVRQVEESRLLADRALYYAQRVPVLMDLQLDRAANRLAAGPGSQKLQNQAASLTDSAARFAAVAEALPGTLSAEREALIRQLSETFTAQQATLMPLLVELREALEAGNVTATSVDQATRSIDALVARLSRKPGEPPGKPFDINEYTRAAAEIARAADELDELLRSTGAAAPGLGSALSSGAAQGRELVDYLVVRVAWLIALLCAGLLATLLLYRWLAPRIHPQ